MEEEEFDDCRQSSTILMVGVFEITEGNIIYSRLSSTALSANRSPRSKIIPPNKRCTPRLPIHKYNFLSMYLSIIFFFSPSPPKKSQFSEMGYPNDR